MVRHLPKYLNSQLSHSIDEHIHNKRDREVLKMKFIDGCSDSEIADSVCTTVRNVQVIISKHIDTLF